MYLQYKSLESSVEKEEIACNKQFLLFPVFSTLLETCPPFSSNLKLSFANSLSLEESKILSFWERVKVKTLPHIPNFYRPFDRRLLKTLQGKEKIPVTNIFSFAHNVFHPVKDKFFIIKKNFDFQSTNVMNLDESKILIFHTDSSYITYHNIHSIFCNYLLPKRWNLRHKSWLDTRCSCSVCLHMEVEQ